MVFEKRYPFGFTSSALSKPANHSEAFARTSCLSGNDIVASFVDRPACERQTFAPNQGISKRFPCLVPSPSSGRRCICYCSIASDQRLSCLQAKKDKRSSKVAPVANEDGRSISPEDSSVPSEAAMNGVKRKGPSTSERLPGGMSAPAAAAAGLAVNLRPKGSDLVSQPKRFKAVEELKPKHADRSVYASIFTSSSRDTKETYMCRSLPLGRN